MISTVKAWFTRIRSHPWVLPGALGIAGVLCIHHSISSYKARLGYGMEARAILIAKRALPMGTVFHGEDASVFRVPAGLLPIGVLAKEDWKSLPGRALLRPVGEGQMLTWSDFDLSYLPSGPAGRITKGYRSLAVSVDATSAAAFSIRPGDHVDLIHSLGDAAESLNDPSTFTLLQNVTVLDTGTEGAEKVSGYSTATLMVLPREAMLITQAATKGRLTLALRHPDDFRTLNDLPMYSSSDVLQEALRHSLQDERNRSIEIIRGIQKSMQSARLD